MKKVLAFLMLLVYVTVSTGFVVSMHYCMDRFDSVQLGQSASDKCHKCGMHKHQGCCHDDVKMVKLQLTHMAAKTSTIFPAAPAIVPSAICLLDVPAPHNHFTGCTLPSGPPLSDQDAYIFHCVFRL